MMRSVSASVLGLDGCPGGWVGALVDAAGRVAWHVAADAANLLELDAAAVGVDIPIGLPDRGRRPADQAARDRLGPARSSVFYAPVRAVLAESGYDAANRVSRERSGWGLSKQSWHLVDRIRQVDRVVSPERQRRVVEVHPELSFRAADPRVDAGKRTGRGTGQRLRALAGWVDPAVLADLPVTVPAVDALDALAAAWSARRWRDGEAEVLPARPDRDLRGLLMEVIV